MALLEQSLVSAAAVGRFTPGSTSAKVWCVLLNVWPSLARVTVAQHLQWEAAFLVVDISGIHEVVSLTGLMHGRLTPDVG